MSIVLYRLRYCLKKWVYLVRLVRMRATILIKGNVQAAGYRALVKQADALQIAPSKTMNATESSNSRQRIRSGQDIG